MISQMDLCLVPFPFSDQSGRKVRPVVVISKNDFNEKSEDVIVVGVTSNLSKDRFSILFSNEDLIEGKLHSACCVKVENILKIDKEMIIKKIGIISPEKFGQVLNCLFRIFK